MWRPIHQRDHLRLVNRQVSRRQAVLIQRGLRIPVFTQQLDSRIALGVVHIKPDTARLGTRESAMLLQKLPHARDVYGIFHSKLDVDVEHRRPRRTGDGNRRFLPEAGPTCISAAPEECVKPIHCPKTPRYLMKMRTLETTNASPDAIQER